MLISHKFNFVFIAVHKTASTTIRNSLDDYSDIKGNSDENSPFFIHSSASKLKSHFEEKQWNWDSYFTFAFVRNPWERLVSAYHYREKMISRWEKNNPTDVFLKQVYQSFRNELTQSKNFLDWVDKFVVNGEYDVAKSQSDYIVNSSGASIVSYIGKLENLQKDFNFVCSNVGLPTQKLKTINSSNHKCYQNYFDYKTIKSVRKFYEKDVEMFKYEFGD